VKHPDRRTGAGPVRRARRPRLRPARRPGARCGIPENRWVLDLLLFGHVEGEAYLSARVRDPKPDRGLGLRPARC
jgi:hypothetical protein